MRGNFRPQTKHWTHWTDFNSRLYMRGNLVNCSMPPNVYYFNSRLYMRGNNSFTTPKIAPENFNSRLYMRGNFCLPRSPAPQCISIHASTWEATLFWCIKLSVFKISIHASTWEAAASNIAVVVSMSYFNSRLYMRGSHLTENCAEDREAISIHASTWEAAYFSCFFSL